MSHPAIRPNRLSVLLVALLAAAALSACGDDGDDVVTGKNGPVIAEQDDLSATAERLGHPVYWAGERDGTKIELAESDSGRVYVRYLDGDAEAGVRSAQFLTVATYPVPDGAATLRKAAKDRPRAELARTDDGALMLIDPQTPGSVRIAYPGDDQQVEVYSPDVGEGLRLVKSGDVQPVP